MEASFVLTLRFGLVLVLCCSTSGSTNRHTAMVGAALCCARIRSKAWGAPRPRQLGSFSRQSKRGESTRATY